MTVRRDSVQTRNETGTRRRGTDTLSRVCARCLSPMLVQYGEGLNGETARHSHCVTLACNPFSWGLFRLLFPL